MSANSRGAGAGAACHGSYRPAQVTDEGVVELEQWPGSDAHDPQANGRRRGASTLTTVNDLRNPHVGAPFTDDDAAIAAALEDVSVPVLLCSLVHMTGDPSWIRDGRSGACRTPPTCRAVSTTRSLPTSGDARCRPSPPTATAGASRTSCRETSLVEMMAFLAGKPLEGIMVPMFLEDMQFDGADSDAISWGDEVSDEAKAASPVVVIGCGLSGILAGIRLSQAGLPFVIVEKDEGPGGTWWENAYPGARVDVGSHHYCYAFEPSHHWTEYFCQQPELRDYFVARARQVRAPSALPLRHRR